MIRFLFSLCIVAIMAWPVEGQLFRRSVTVANCPGGNCPTVSAFTWQDNASAVVSQRTVTRTHYPIRPPSTWWTGCDSWRHLTIGEHTGQFDSVWLQSLSWNELQSLHSDAHDGRIRWASVVRNAGRRVVNTVQGVRQVMASAIGPTVIAATPIIVSSPVIQASDIPVMGAVEGNWRDTMAARMILTREALRGNVDARLIRDSPEKLAAFVEALQVEKTAVGANGEFLKWLIQWAADNPDKVKILIDIIKSLF